MVTARRLPVLVVLVGLLVWAPAAALAQDEGSAPATGPDLILLSGTASVPRGTTVDEVIVVRGRADIEGVALGDVIVLSGPVVIDGQVSGSVIAVSGRVSLGPNAQVGGDVRARGRIQAADGAAVGGAIRQYAAFTWRAPIDVFGRFAGWLAVTVSTLSLGLLLVLVAPRGLDAVGGAGRTAPWISAGWGLAIAIALPVLVLLLAVSLLGLPLALALLFALGLLGLVGYVLTMFAVGRAIWAPPRNRAVAFALGWTIVRAIGAIPYVSGVTAGLAAVWGLGAGGVAVWRVRSVGGKHREGKAVVWSEAMREETGL